jgi:hypothetical protein
VPLPGKCRGQMPELAGEILVKQENLHREPPEEVWSE